MTGPHLPTLCGTPISGSISPFKWRPLDPMSCSLSTSCLGTEPQRSFPLHNPNSTFEFPNHSHSLFPSSPKSPLNSRPML